MVTEQEVQYLFANYNNISTDIAEEFVAYVFSLLPSGGGVITGDLEITGSLQVDTDFTLDGEVLDNIGPTRSWDFNVRKGYNSAGDETFDYESGILSDTANNSIDWLLRKIYDSLGQEALDYDVRSAVDSSGAESIDWENRVIRFASGAAAYNWETGDVQLSTGGTIAFGTSSEIKKSGSSNGITIQALADANWSFGHNSGELRVTGAFDGGRFLEVLSSDADNSWQRSSNSGQTKYLDFGLIGGNYLLRANISAVATDIFTILEASGKVGVKKTPTYDFDITGDVNADAYRVAGSAGADGSFTTTDLKTVTVTKGIITAIV